MFPRHKTKAFLIGLLLWGLLFFFHDLFSPFSPSVESSPAPSAATRVSGRVTRVIDGDTIDVEVAGVRTRVRLIGVDTPETVDPHRPVECFGKEASDFVSLLVNGRIVTLESDPTQSRTDKYGRQLAYVSFDDGTLVNELLVREGYAYEYTYGEPYRFQSVFRSAQREAQHAARGLWDPARCPSVQQKPHP